MYSETNIFGIENPEAYFCQVWRYHRSHSRLLIRCYKDKFYNEEFYLLFGMVMYIEGPLSWQSADFCIGDSAECVNLLHPRGFEEIPEEGLLKTYRLYVVDLSDGRVVKILAASHTEKTTSIPPDFF